MRPLPSPGSGPDGAGGLPLPPGSPREQPRPQRRRALTEGLIVETALRIVATQGIAAVTMRRVAGELGVAASSLYPHVGSRERLLDLAVRDVLGGMAPLEASGDWRADLRAHFLAVRARLAEHADLVQHAFFSAVAPTSADDLHRVEDLLARLAAEGLEPGLALAVHDRLMLYTVADVYEGWQRSQRRDEAEVTAWLGEFEGYLAGLPEERFPHLRAHARELVAPDPEERFRVGLDLMLAGVEAGRVGA